MKNKRLFKLFITIFLGSFLFTSCLEEGENKLTNYPSYGIVQKVNGLLLIWTPNGYFYPDAWQQNQDKWEQNTPIYFVYDLDFDNQTSSSYYIVTIKDYAQLDTFVPIEKNEDSEETEMEVFPLESFSLISDTIFKPYYFFDATWSKDEKFTYDISYSKDESNNKLFHVEVTPVITTESGIKYRNFVIDFTELIRKEGYSSLRDSLKVDFKYVSGKDDTTGDPEYTTLPGTLLLWKSTSSTTSE